MPVLPYPGIMISTKFKLMRCPFCGLYTSKIHVYRYQTIEDLPLMAKNTILILKKRRYQCSCGKRFLEAYDFLPKYSRMINRLSAFIIAELRNCVPASFVASKSNVSTHTVSRIFNFVQYDKPVSLPKVLAIDEFRGNAGGEKYQCILVDPMKKAILDILSDRKQNHLIEISFHQTDFMGC